MLALFMMSQILVKMAALMTVFLKLSSIQFELENKSTEKPPSDFFYFFFFIPTDRTCDALSLGIPFNHPVLSRNLRTATLLPGRTTAVRSEPFQSNKKHDKKNNVMITRKMRVGKAS